MDKLFGSRYKTAEQLPVRCGSGASRPEGTREGELSRDGQRHGRLAERPGGSLRAGGRGPAGNPSARRPPARPVGRPAVSPPGLSVPSLSRRLAYRADIPSCQSLPKLPVRTFPVANRFPVANQLPIQLPFQLPFQLPIPHYLENLTNWSTHVSAIKIGGEPRSTFLDCGHVRGPVSKVF